jgi:hypothetical protein
MFRLFVVIAVLLIPAHLSFSGPDRGKDAEFFAGVTVLQQQTGITPGEKARKFRELEAMTGITAAEAKAILLDYRQKPVEWRTMYGEMMKLLNETNIALKKTDGVRTPVHDTVKKAASARTPNPAPVSKTNDKRR